MNIDVLLSSLRQKGNLAYEYNPLHNYQTDVDLYKLEINGRTFLLEEYEGINIDNYEKVYDINKGVNSKWVDKRNKIISNHKVKTTTKSDLFARAGSLIDFDTVLSI